MCVCVLGLDDDGDVKGNYFSALSSPCFSREKFWLGTCGLRYTCSICFPKTAGGSKAVTQGNGDVAADAARSNGYTCSDCSLLSERRNTLTACSASQGTVSRIYSRDRNQKRKSRACEG